MRRVVVVENDPVVPPGDLARVAAAAGVELEVVPAHDATLPTEGFDGVVVLGGRMGVHDQDRYPYLSDELSWLRDLVDRDVPVLGICLGAQLLAEALGGRAYRAPSPEVMVGSIGLTEAGRADPVVSAFDDLPVLVMHEDTFDLHLANGTIVTDAGSTKRDVIAAIYAHLGDHLGHSVPAHPIAGAETSGVDAAFPDLFRERNVVITALPENESQAIEKVAQAWTLCGSTIRRMSPQDHDRVFAAVSHLPHLLAYALVHDLAGRANGEELFSYAASGFRDFTRIAGSHPEMWRDICLANRHALIAELDEYLAELAYLRALLMSNDGDKLEALFATARKARNRWAEKTFPS